MPLFGVTTEPGCALLREHREKPFVGRLPKYNTSRRKYGRRVSLCARCQPPGSRVGKHAGVTMALKTFTAKIFLPKGGTQEIMVQADDVFKARDIIKMQYGNPKLFSGPTEVRR